MTLLRTALEMRREEFDAHFALAKALEDRMILETDSLGDVNISSVHINTLKSGLLVHLYNVEEALMSQALDFLGAAIGAVEPRRWNEQSRREWLRESIVARTTEGNEDTRLDTVFRSSNLLLSTDKLGPQRLKKPSGSWDDKGISIFLSRMSMTLTMPAEMWIRIDPTPYYADQSPLEFLADRRNALAHGRRSFEQGANDLQLIDIRNLADIVLDYLEYVADSFQNHVENESHLIAAA